MKRFVFTLLLAVISLGAAAQSFKKCVSIRLDSETGVYAKGDTVRVYADVKKVPEQEVELQIREFNKSKAYSREDVTLEKGENLIYEGVFDEATHQTFRLSEKGAKDKDNARFVTVGALVAPEEFKVGFDEPADLLDFWGSEIKTMRKEKMKPILTKEESPEEGIEVYAIEINCVGPHPVRGYIAFPEGAKKKSLPAILLLHSASTVDGSSYIKDLMPYAKMGALVVDVNAHGMLNQQPKEYYAALYAGELKGYSSREPFSREDYYFKWMFLRAQRTLDYICTNKLWDKKHLVVSGTSQGGGQSAFLASMDPRVTAAVLTVPAMLDQGGSLKGRTCSWPKTMLKYPDSSLKNSPYFDPAVMLKYTKAEVWCEIGLFDTTCHPANVYAAMNEVQTPKTIVTFQRNHTFKQTPELRKFHQPVAEQRKDFIRHAFGK